MQRLRSEASALVGLYSRAQVGEYNLSAFLRENPGVQARSGVRDINRDDAELAIQLGEFVGRHKYAERQLRRERLDERVDRAVRRLVTTARYEDVQVRLEADVLLGDLLATGRKYICFDLQQARVVLPRQALLRARKALRPFPDVVAYVDERGLHLRWREGRGGLNFPPQRQEQESTTLVDLRPHALPKTEPVRLAEILADLALL